MKVIFIKILFTTIIISYLNIATAETAIPPFLKVGNHYTFVLPGDQGDVEIIEIDNSSGWVRVKSKRSILKNAWVNIHSVVSIIPLENGGSKNKKTRKTDMFNSRGTDIFK